MSWILKIDNVGKIYRLGGGALKNGTLYQQVVSYMKNKKLNRNLKADDHIDVITETPSVIVSDAQVNGLPDGYFWALKDVSFTIDPGDKIGLIGKNGSGKSTLLKILSRITSPTCGEMQYRGHLVSLLEVGAGFHSEFTGRENIYLNAAINGMSRKKVNMCIRDIIDFSEIGKQIDTPIKRYSSGMYMRLAFSVAAFLESDILLLDEVLAVGDTEFQKKCREKMISVANDGRTVILVSHDESTIQGICNKTIELEYGRIIDTKIIDKIKNETPLVNDLQFKEKEILKYKTDASIIINEKSDSLCSEKFWDICDKVDPAIKLLSCKAIDDNDVCKVNYSVNENINIEMKFTITEPLFFVTQVMVSSSEGVPVFCSMSELSEVNVNNAVIHRTCIKKLTIPKEFFNEGVFNISFMFYVSLNQEPLLSISNCLSIKIVDDFMFTGARGNWPGEWPKALLRPKFDWKISHQDAC